jgi:hypothetical protein
MSKPTISCRVKYTAATLRQHAPNHPNAAWFGQEGVVAQAIDADTYLVQFVDGKELFIRRIDLELICGELPQYRNHIRAKRYRYSRRRGY